MNNKIMNQNNYEELELSSKNGLAILTLNTLGIILGVVVFFLAVSGLVNGGANSPIYIILIVLSSLYVTIIGPIMYAGIKILKPNEALVFTLFGKYTGTLKKEGLHFVNPFSIAMNPGRSSSSSGSFDGNAERPSQVETPYGNVSIQRPSFKKSLSLKAMTLNNDKQKINDKEGNPIIVGVVVVWRIVNTAKAVFNIDNYNEFLSIQTDSTTRDIIRLYPYDSPDHDVEKSLRGGSQEVADKIKTELQNRIGDAGLEILEARITSLSYAPEIASAMLQKQQASAIVAARQLIVEGAVGMVDMALEQLSDKDIVNLDEERKAAMVSNLLVVLCGNRDAQPIVNSGSIY